MKYLYPILAVNLSGKTQLFYSFEEVRNFCHKNKVGLYWEPAPFCGSSRLYAGTVANEWILRDDCGRLAKPEDFIESREEWHKRWKKNRRGKHEYRNGPVPHAGNWRGIFKFRAPRKKNGASGVRSKNRARLAEFKKEIQDY